MLSDLVINCAERYEDRSTIMNGAQENELARIVVEDPKARTKGWHFPTGGPLIEMSDGSYVSIRRSGNRRWLVRVS